MTKYVVFENPGEIDPVAMVTFGINVKETENPIGFFGTGLKYAMAILVRTGHELVVQAGEHTYHIGSRETEVRGKSFQIVTLQKDFGSIADLGFTTDLGKNWELWQAYRELACNAYDEGGNVTALEVDDNAAMSYGPRDGKTRVIVSGDDFAEIHEKRSEFLIKEEPTWKAPELDIFDRASMAIFYRGMRVSKIPHEKPSLLTYSIQSYVYLTEDRTAAYDWMLAPKIAKSILACDHPGVIKKVLRADSNTFEGSFKFVEDNGTVIGEISQAFSDVVAALNEEGSIFNYTAVRACRAKAAALAAGGGGWYSASHTVPIDVLDRARKLCSLVGIPVSDYRLNIADIHESGVFYSVSSDAITIDPKVFEKPMVEICRILILAYAELHHKFTEVTVALEQWLIEVILTQAYQLEAREMPKQTAASTKDEAERSLGNEVPERTPMVAEAVEEIPF